MYVCKPVRARDDAAKWKGPLHVNMISFATTPNGARELFEFVMHATLLLLLPLWLRNRVYKFA